MAKAPDIPSGDQCTPPRAPTGGYDCDFVDPLPDSLTCPVCYLAFRDPHLLDCCGAKYCESCIKAAGQPCPLCKQPFNTMVDKGFKRKVLDLKVSCSKKSGGCKWEGELRHLDEHEREECGWALVQCRYECGGRFPRSQLAEHEHEECSQRPVVIKFESFARKMEEKLASEKECHQREMAAVRKRVEQLEQSLRGELHTCCSGRSTE